MTSAMSPRGWQKPRDAPKSRLMTSSLLCATTRKSSGVLRNCYSFKKSFKMQNGSLTMQRGNPQRRAKAKSSSLLYMYSFIYCYDDLFGAFFFSMLSPFSPPYYLLYRSKLMRSTRLLRRQRSWARCLSRPMSWFQYTIAFSRNKYQRFLGKSM